MCRRVVPQRDQGRRRGAGCRAMFSPVGQPTAASRAALVEWANTLGSLASCNAHEQAKFWAAVLVAKAARRLKHGSCSETTIHRSCTPSNSPATLPAAECSPAAPAWPRPKDPRTSPTDRRPRCLGLAEDTEPSVRNLSDGEVGHHVAGTYRVDGRSRRSGSTRGKRRDVAGCAIDGGDVVRQRAALRSRKLQAAAGVEGTPLPSGLAPPCIEESGRVICREQSIGAGASRWAGEVAEEIDDDVPAAGQYKTTPLLDTGKMPAAARVWLA